MALRDLPDVFTIPEAAALLRIGRNTAYEQARIWRATGGQEGLPVLTLGSRLLVSKAQLERLLGMEPAEGNDDAAAAAGEAGKPSGRGRRALSGSGTARKKCCRLITASSSSYHPHPRRTHPTHPLQPRTPTFKPSR